MITYLIFSIIIVATSSIVALWKSNNLHRDVYPMNESFKKFIWIYNFIISSVLMMVVLESLLFYLHESVKINLVYPVAILINILAAILCMYYSRNLSKEIANKLILYDRIGSILENKTKSGIYEWDVDGDNIRWSTGVYRIFDIDDDIEINHEIIEDRIDENSLHAYRASLNRILNTTSSESITYLINTIHGVKYVEQMMYRNEYQGQIVRIFGVIKDVTDTVIDDMRNEITLNKAKIIVASRQQKHAYGKLINKINLERSTG
jgi:PAS domain-containing protein